MNYVIDCSVAFKWVVPEFDSARAVQLRDDYCNAVHWLLAPDTFPAEIGNAILVAGWRGRIPAGQGALLLRDVLNTSPVLFASIPDLLPRAYEIGEQVRETVYDCLYVALAEQQQCELITADDKLIKALAAKFPFIVPLASLP